MSTITVDKERECLQTYVLLSHLLVTHKDDGDIGAEVLDLGCPLLGDVLQAVRRVYTKAHQDDVGVWVGQGTQSVVVLLAGGIPQCQLNLGRGKCVNEVLSIINIIFGNSKLMTCDSNDELVR